MSKELRFDGKVAIVTGAGGGLGRSHAMLLASRGARVVVNDLGGTHTGEGASQKAADAVVEEIRAAGGEAVPSYNSVERGEAIVKTALESFGRLDIVINNAGILRDVSFHKMSQEDWDLVYKVHVLGSFRLTHAAWPVLREQRYGRVVMTASAAGIYGNFGQANYSMAKLGLFGLANSLAIEGQRRGIHVNTIAPIAGSRMTETVLPPNLLEALKPEYVSPLVAWLCHEECGETGGLFEVGGGFYGKLRWERARGKVFRLGREVTPETVAGSWEAVTSFEDATHPDSVAASMQPIMENVEAGPSKGGNELIDVDRALGYQFPETESSYDERDLALYALGVGAGKDPTDERELQLVYEMHGGGMKALPTFGVIPAINTMMSLAKAGKQAPGLNYGLDRLLHGEQYTELKRPLPARAKLTHRPRIKDIFDKGKHALVVTEVVSYDEDGNELIRNELTSLIRGAGGWGGERGPSADRNEPPDRPPDAVIEEKIPESQALLYRLSGDWNPLHADPGFARAFGFERPILHGLCSFGYACRHVLSRFAPDGDPDYFKSIRARFSDSVFPGETLVTEMWKGSDTRVLFRCKVKERDSVAVSGASLELYEEIPKPKPKAAKKESAGGELRPVSGDIFRAIGAFVAEHPEVAEKVKTTFQFALSDPDSVWTVDLSQSPGSVSEGETAKPQCTLAMSDADFMAMATGKADPMQLFSTGKLKISGDVMASQKLGFLKKITPEMVMAEAKKRAGSEGSAGEASGSAAEPEPTSWDVFIAIRDHVERHPDLAGKVGHVFLFRIKDPDSRWTLDLKNGAGSVTEGEAEKPDCTLEISERDFIDMTTGKADAMKLFSTGKLKISGNVMASQKLDFLRKMDSEKAKEAVTRARAAGEGPGAGSAGAGAGPSEPNGPAIFDALGERLAARPALRDEVSAKLLFRVTDPEGSWLVDLASDPPAVRAGEEADAGAVFTLSDADLAALVRKEAAARDLYQQGRLRVDGDVALAHRLGFLKGLI